MHETQDTRPTLRLRRDQWERRMNAEGLESDNARARAIRVSRTTVARIQAGEIEPGERFIAAALGAFPELKFEDLFEVIEVAESVGT